MEHCKHCEYPIRNGMCACGKKPPAKEPRKIGWLSRLVRACVLALIRVLEWALLALDGWRPCRIKGRGDGRLWFWKSKKRNQVLSREIAYEVTMMDYRPNVKDLARRALDSE